ncbi:RNA polymerase sigma factor [Paludisphaera rhizosphaerae]|uniref:RNA polymerase sigma factor n=1 Tax=Paludisphaera rhizosphaerae TaxID=2711216 RepID=UPI0013EA0E31|nr:sigma-70 family RNA polymerase sigma factor [Paludisphaera rhizosphaerae]
MQPDAEIVRAVLDGDREAFAALVARHERAAWATAWRVLRDDHAAADAAQEAFLQAFHRLADLRRPERFGVWLLRITKRESVRLGRRLASGSGRPLDGDGGEARASPASDVPADAEELLAAVARLPEHERLVVALHYLEGRPVAEVAAVLGRPVGTVTKQLSRAIERLRVRTKGVLG